MKVSQAHAVVNRLCPHKLSTVYRIGINPTGKLALELIKSEIKAEEEHAHTQGHLPDDEMT